LIKGVELNNKLNIKIDEISEILDITPPFLMLTEALNSGDMKKLEGIQEVKNFSWCTNSHLLRQPVFPATLLMEGMLQTMVLLIYLSYEHKNNYSFVKNINFKIFKSIASTDKITHIAEIISFRRGIINGFINSFVEANKVAQCEVIYASPSLFYKSN
jgi:3-hydroxymyristoyl/3-hydroxydecanoyl-(acyl carrier protein) dehydratase